MPDSTLPHRSPWSLSRAEWVLVAITMFWGGTFITVQHALSVTGPMFFVGLRFATAALVIALLFVGLVLLAGPEGTTLTLSLGEALTLLGALAIAAEILLISGYAGKVDVRRVTVVQLAVASLCGFAAMGPSGEAVPPMSALLLGSAMGLGLASALIQFGMNWAQRSVSPTRATLIYAGEPVWAGLIGRIAGERLPFLGLVGGVLIVASIVVSQLGGTKRTAEQGATGEP